MKKTAFVFMVLLGMVVAGIARATEIEVMRIGVLAYRGHDKAISDWQPHAEYLSQRLLNPKRFEIVPLKLEEFPAAIAERRIDLVITNTGHYVELESGGKVSRIATMRIAGPNGPVDRFGGIAIASSQRKELNTYADLRGQRLMVPDRQAFGGWQVHLPEAKAAGIDLVSDTRQIIELQNQEKIVAGVLDGTADVGFVRSDLIESMAAAGKLDLRKIRVVGEKNTPGYPYAHSTRLYPHWPFARLDHVSEEIARNLMIALLELPPDHPAARAAGINGWTLPHSYQSVRELFLEFRLGPYADLPIRFSDIMLRYGIGLLLAVLTVVTLLLVAFFRVIYANRALRMSQDQLQLAAGVFSHAQEGIIITDPKGYIIDANDTFLGLTGYSRQEVLGQNPRFLSSGKQDKAFYQEMWHSLMEKGTWRGDLWNRRKDGSLFVQQTSISAVRTPEGEIAHFIGLSNDISELKESQLRLEHMAFFDVLTGLPNRRMLTDRLHQSMALTQRNEQLLAVCYLDLDGFKPVNDTWGHAAGDRLLVEVAHRLVGCVRGGDTVSRLGGDEFVVLLGNLQHLEECEIALDRLRSKLAEPYPLPEGEANLSASIGVTLFPLDESDADTLMRHADQAMYASKQGGRNRYTLFDTDSDRMSEIRKESERDIRRALEGDELILYYQPKVNMRTGEILGVEALVRWQHPERGLLNPADFLPVVDFVGLQSELGIWVLKTALRQMQLWLADGLEVLVSVNIAAHQLQSKDFVDTLRDLLAGHADVPAIHLELEILETAALDDLTHVADVIEVCHAMGVHFAIDDFGTGYSSLTYLKQLQANTLKIDQSFVRDMLEDPDDLAIVDGIVGLAMAFRRDVIAEGVETVAHGRMLVQLGCDAAQGYGIARPMPADDLPAWVRAWRQPDEWRDVTVWPREDLPLLTVEIDHQRWIRLFGAALQTEGQPAAQWPALDQHDCRFGHWLDGGGKQRYGHHPAFARLVDVHANVHQTGKEIMLHHTRDPAAARVRLPELHICRDNLLAQLSALRAEAGLPES